MRVNRSNKANTETNWARVDNNEQDNMGYTERSQINNQFNPQGQFNQQGQFNPQTVRYKKKHRWLSRIILSIFVVIIIIAAVWAKRNLILIDKVVYESESVPKTFVGYKIAYLSDIHNTNKNIVGQIKNEDVDIIVVGGGYADDNGEYDNSIDILKDLSSIAPVIYSINNEDVDITGIENLGESCLYANSTGINLGSKEIGVEEYMSSILNVNAADIYNDTWKEYTEYLSKKLQEDSTKELMIRQINSIDDTENIKIDENIFNIVIVGDNSLAEEVSKFNIPMIFGSGTHGNNNKSKYSNGIYSIGGSTLFVGCGVDDTKSNKAGLINVSNAYIITLSDGTIEDKNPLEKLLGLIIKDVGTVFDNDGGFQKYVYEYQNGQEK